MMREFFITVFRNPDKGAHKFLIAPVFRPDICICGNEFLKRKYFPSAVFIPDLKPDPHILFFTFGYDTVAEFGVIGTNHFVYVEDDTFVPDHIVRQEVHVAHYAIVADDA
jgi:hypothetical protein